MNHVKNFGTAEKVRSDVTNNPKIIKDGKRSIDEKNVMIMVSYDSPWRSSKTYISFKIFTLNPFILFKFCFMVCFRAMDF